MKFNFQTPPAINITGGGKKVNFMNTFTYIITDENGIHARPAGMLVKFAQSTPDRITVKNKDKSADATRLFAIMGLGAKKGDMLEFTINGENSEETTARLREFCIKTH